MKSYYSTIKATWKRLRKDRAAETILFLEVFIKIRKKMFSFILVLFISFYKHK